MTSDPSAALIQFEAARTSAEQIQENAYADWKVYIDATIAYARQDIEALQAAHALLGEGANKEIAESLIQGLKERGEIDYRHDYRRVVTENGLTVKEEQDILKASEEAKRGINVTDPMSVEDAIAYLQKGLNED